MNGINFNGINFTKETLPKSIKQNFSEQNPLHATILKIAKVALYIIVPIIPLTLYISNLIFNREIDPLTIT